VPFAALVDGFVFGPASCVEDVLAAAEVDIGRREIVQALVAAAVIVMFDAGFDSALQITRPESRGYMLVP